MGEGELRHLELGTGTTVVVRALQASDRPALEALYRDLSARDLQLRFFNESRPSPRLLDRWFEIDDERLGRLVALEDGVLVGDAGWYRRSGGDAELDIAVAPHHRGWLGPFLLDALVEHARDHGVRNLVAEVDRSNAPMLAVLHERGCATVGHEEASVVVVAIGARDAVPGWPAGAGRPRLLVEGDELPWGAEDVARTYGAELVGCHIAAGPGRTACPALRGDPCPLAAAADAVVVALPPEHPHAGDLLAAHRRRHPDAALVVTGWPAGAAVDPEVGHVDALDVVGVEALLRRLGVPVALTRRPRPGSHHPADPS